MKYRWSITFIDELLNYMKRIYKGLMDMYNEMEEIMGEEGKAHHLSYAKESVRVLARSTLVLTL